MMKKLVKKAVLVLTAAIAITGCTASVSAYAGRNTGYNRTVPVDITDTYEVKYVTGITDSLNVRCDAFGDAGIIGSLCNGQEVIVTGYVEVAYKGNYSPYVRIDFNGMEGYVDADYLSDYAPADPAPAPQPTQESDTVVYPRVDRHLSNAARTTWCSLNTDGYYYNENGERFADNGNGTFSDVYCNVYNVIG